MREFQRWQGWPHRTRRRGSRGTFWWDRQPGPMQRFWSLGSRHSWCGFQMWNTQGISGVVEVVLKGWTSLVTLGPSIPLTTIFSTSSVCVLWVSFREKTDIGGGRPGRVPLTHRQLHFDELSHFPYPKIPKKCLPQGWWASCDDFNEDVMSVLCCMNWQGINGFT